MAPVEDLLAIDSRELVPEEPPQPGEPRRRWLDPPPPGRIIDSIEEADSVWGPKLADLRRFDWSKVESGRRDDLKHFLAAHPDPEVRAAGCRALSEWNATDLLISLANSGPIQHVRKSSMYYLAEVPPRSEVAILAWKLIASGSIASTRGREALRTYAAHEQPVALRVRLLDLARTDRRESIRHAAADLLDQKDAMELRPLLDDPPLVTWGVHTTLISRCSEIPRQTLAALREVDNLDVAAALADRAE